MATQTNHVQKVKVNIPTALRSFTSNEKSVELSGTTVAEILSGLTDRFPSLRQHLFDGEGNLRSFVSIYLGDEDIRHLDREHTVVAHADELSIVPSIAGGSGRFI
ncbi:MAG: MoaD/ThiS family protein [Rhodothermales bacterium]|nr:MoaD/ThiS family protein [Rhodothermales bacterium]